MSKKSRRNFTLLELMVAIALIAIAAGAVSWKLHALLERKKFMTDVGSVKQALVQGRSMAINTRSDWELVMEKGKKGWSYRLLCREEGGGPLFSPQTGSMGLFSLFLDKKEMRKCTFVFYSTGLVEPDGIVELTGAQAKEAWSVAALMRKIE